MGRTVKCVILGKKGDGLDYPPVPGELGQKIYEASQTETPAEDDDAGGDDVVEAEIVDDEAGDE